MKRTEFESFIEEHYGICSEYPFEKYPNFAVFRHAHNKKWFAVVMTIPKNKLGINEDGNIDVVNLKCRTDLLLPLWEENGIYPAYHMNKEHWISVCLDGSVALGTLCRLLDASFELTYNKVNFVN